MQSIRPSIAIAFFAVWQCFAAGGKISAVIIDGVINHDWAAGTAAITTIVEGSGRFTVDVATFPRLPDFSHYDVVVSNFSNFQSHPAVDWPAQAKRALDAYVRNGGGLVIFHAANNAFPDWPEYNQMIGLGWRDPSFGPGITIGPGGSVQRIPQGQGLPPGHGPRHDFELFVLNPRHPITQGLPSHWLHPAEQLTHGQHGPAEGLTILSYAFSEVSRQGEPMDWVRQYGKGRVYTTMLGHTWANELNPNLDDVNFQALLARGTEWAATGKVTIPPDLGWWSLYNGRNLDGWEVRGPAVWTVLDNGVLLGQPSHAKALYRQASLNTTREYADSDLHLEYFIPPGGSSSVSFCGHKIQISDPARPPGQRTSSWNSMDVEARAGTIRMRVNGTEVAAYTGDPPQSKPGPIELQLNDQFTSAMFRNLRIRER